MSRLPQCCKTPALGLTTKGLGGTRNTTFTSSRWISTRLTTTFTQCDFLFLAADTMQCRLLYYNAITQQYLKRLVE